MKSKQSDFTLWLCSLSPSLAVIACESLAREGIIKERTSYAAWEEAVSHAVKSIDGLFKSVHKLAVSQVEPNDEQGATWLNPKMR